MGGHDVYGARRLGALAIWVGAVPSDRLFVLEQYQPTIIWTSPSYAWHLGARSPRRRASTPGDFNIHTIIVAGGRVAPSSPRARPSRDLWGAKVVDFYGLSDIYGACAAACEAHDEPDRGQILVETVDPTTGEVLAPGDGRAGVHDAVQKARPMIRFRTSTSAT